MIDNRLAVFKSFVLGWFPALGVIPSRGTSWRFAAPVNLFTKFLHSLIMIRESSKESDKTFHDLQKLCTNKYKVVIRRLGLELFSMARLKNKS